LGSGNWEAALNVILGKSFPAVTAARCNTHNQYRSTDYISTVDMILTENIQFLI
jgi:hypothetical protein